MYHFSSLLDAFSKVVNNASCKYVHDKVSKRMASISLFKTLVFNLVLLSKLLRFGVEVFLDGEVLERLLRKLDTLGDEFRQFDRQV
jgi:hypothetical protein